MSTQDDKHPDQFNASLPLPIDGAARIAHPRPLPEQAAADLIRKRVAQAYADEPSALAETESIESLSPARLSKHQEFIYQLTSTNRPMPEIQTAWHEYYAGLGDDERREVWQEFYAAYPNVSKYAEALASPPKAKKLALTKHYSHPMTKSYSRALSKTKERYAQHLTPRTQAKANSPMRSMFFGLAMGSIVAIIFLFSFFNERFIAPFIQPSRNVTNTPIISSTAPLSNEPKIIIPKINVEIPVVYTVDTLDESAIQKGLEQGVVHYADTATPGQNGNLVIVGHSSNNIFNPGKYKFAFVLLNRMEIGDSFYLQKDGKRYTYQIYSRQVVPASDISVLGLRDKPATATLITCDPPGTSANRLIVVGEQVDPSPSANNLATTTSRLATQSQTIPGNSQSLWSRIIKWLSY